jgi:hypothetical protein
MQLCTGKKAGKQRPAEVDAVAGKACAGRQNSHVETDSPPSEYILIYSICSIVAGTIFQSSIKLKTTHAHAHRERESEREVILLGNRNFKTVQPSGITRLNRYLTGVLLESGSLSYLCKYMVHPLLCAYPSPSSYSKITIR